MRNWFRRRTPRYQVEPLAIPAVLTIASVETAAQENLKRAIILELDAPRDISFAEIRSTIYPGKTLRETWDSLWADKVDPDDYLANRSKYRPKS